MRSPTTAEVTDEYVAVIVRLHAEVKRLRSVLQFYASATSASFDNGYRASEALKQTEK